MNQSLLGMGEDNRTPSSLADEPTEFLPNGLDMRGQIFGQANVEDYYVAESTTSEPGGGFGIGSEVLAMVQVLSQLPGFEANGDDLGKEKFLLGKRTVLRLRAEVAPSHGLQGTLVDPLPVSGEAFTVSTLPQAKKDELIRKAKLIQDSPLLHFLKLSREMGTPVKQAELPPP